MGCESHIRGSSTLPSSHRRAKNSFELKDSSNPKVAKGSASRCKAKVGAGDINTPPLETMR